MGHLVAKDVYGALGDRIDGLQVRTPQNAAFRAMLRELYSPDEAELIVGMPFTLSTVDRIARATGRDRHELEPRLAALCDKGLVVDLDLGGTYHYMPAPFVIGIFEFTMMRLDSSDEEVGKFARLFVDYLEGGEFYAANFGHGQQVSVARALPHLDHLDDHVEILDYERVDRVIEEAESFSVSNCSCRHKKHHAGGQVCKVPLETCTSFGSRGRPRRRSRAASARCSRTWISTTAPGSTSSMPAAAACSAPSCSPAPPRPGACRSWVRPRRARRRYAEPVARTGTTLDLASHALTGRCSETACRISSIRGPGRVANVSMTSSGTG